MAVAICDILMGILGWFKGTVLRFRYLFFLLLLLSSGRRRIFLGTEGLSEEVEDQNAGDEDDATGQEHDGLDIEAGVGVLGAHHLGHTSLLHTLHFWWWFLFVF
eukprot:124440_1